MCKHKIYNHLSYIYLTCLGIKKTIIIIKKNEKKNETINLTKIYKTVIFNLKKVNIKSLRDKKEIYGEI